MIKNMLLLQGIVIFFNTFMIASGDYKNSSINPPKIKRLSLQAQSIIIEDQNSLFAKPSTYAPSSERKTLKVKQSKIALQRKALQSFRWSSRSPSPKT